jgi:phosphoserine phosphatase
MRALWIAPPDTISGHQEHLVNEGLTAQRLDTSIFRATPAVAALGVEGDLDHLMALTTGQFVDLLPIPQGFDLKLAVFDMDSTLIQHEVIDELATALGIGAEVAAITERAMQGQLDFVESFTARLGLLKGLSEARLQPIYDSLRLMPGAESLMQNLADAGVYRAICSGGFSFFADQLGQRLGVDAVHSNQLQCTDGMLTGVVVPPIVDGAYKANFLNTSQHRFGLSRSHVMAVGDGANDIPMLQAASAGVAFRAKPAVREAAPLRLDHADLSALSYLVHPWLARDGESSKV